MIEAIEEVLKHWGAYVLSGSGSGGLASPAGTLVEWKGCPPRTGSGGSRMLMSGAGPDFVAAEVGAALSAIERADGGTLLWRLAIRRYAYQPALSVEEQVSDLDLGRGAAGRKAYTRAVHRLHELLQVHLVDRQAVRCAQIGQAKRDGERYRRASVRQLEKAHAGRVKELFRGGAADRSSGDSAPVGAVAPRQAPVRNNR